MYQQPYDSNRFGPVGVILAALLIFAFISLVILVAILTLTGQSLTHLGAAASPSPRPGPTATIAPLTAVTPNPAELATFRSIALGVEFDYPPAWRRKESSLRVVLAPSPAGLEPGQLAEPALWIGIPADNSLEPAAVLTHILADFPPHTKPSGQSALSRNGIDWILTGLTFEQTGQAGVAQVAIAAHNEVAYYLVALAPAAQWPQTQALLEDTLGRFRFTQEAVIRPTDSTPPPTPTPSPTPRIYIVQSGDTLGAIAGEYGVTIEAIMNRNGIDDPRSLRSGQKLIIPNKKK